MKNRKMGYWLLLALLSAPVYAKQWGLVVGIDIYPHAAHLDHLQGAVNDARLLAKTLRTAGVDLPEERLLLNERATLPKFQQAWASLLLKAKPGDRLIVTFAGHGTRLPDIAPLDEKTDGKDEALLFYDYAAERPKTGGLLLDDALYGLLQQAHALSVTFLADTCYSGGMLRSPLIATKQPMRGDPAPLDLAHWTTPEPDFAHFPAVPDNLPLEHVTFLTAADKENLRIAEYPLPEPGGNIHGALSWAFAQAIAGEADTIQRDGVISRDELEEYLRVNVKRASHNQQTPKLLPRGDEHPIFTLAAAAPGPIATPPSQFPDLAIKVEGGTAPHDLAGVRFDGQQYTLLFKIAGGKATAYQNGDLLTVFPADDTAAWRKLIAKHRLLNTLDGAYRKNRPVSISLEQGDGAHFIDKENPELLDFRFDPHSDYQYLLLFNLAGTGELQFLYPLPTDPAEVKQLPYRLSLKAEEPAGRDDLVAVFCADEPSKARALLNSHDKGIAPTSTQLLSVLPPHSACQVGHYESFTRDKE